MNSNFKGKQSGFDPNLGIRFKAVRKALKLTQIEMAKQLKSSQGTITDIEKLKVHVSPNFADRFFDVFNVNVNWFYSGEGDMFNAPGQANEAPINSAGSIRKKKRTFISETAKAVFQSIIANNKKTLLSATDECNNLWHNVSALVQFISLYDELLDQPYFLNRLMYEIEHNGEKESIEHYRGIVEKLPAVVSELHRLNGLLSGTLERLKPLDFLATMESNNWDELLKLREEYYKVLACDNLARGVELQTEMMNLEIELDFARKQYTKFLLDTKK